MTVMRQRGNNHLRLRGSEAATHGGRVNIRSESTNAYECTGSDWPWEAGRNQEGGGIQSMHGLPVGPEFTFHFEGA